MRSVGKVFKRCWLLSIILLFTSAQHVCGQATFQNTGQWSLATNWSGNNIGDLLSENVTINTLQGATISTGQTYGIGHLTFASNSSLSVNGTGVLNIGSSGNPRNLTAGSGVTIIVFGSLIVWGNMVVNSDLALIVTGTLTVRGNVQMANNSILGVTGNINILGNLTTGDNVIVGVVPGGFVDVGGTVTVGQNALLAAFPGGFHAHACSQGSASNFCGVLPVHLVSFTAAPEASQNRLEWSTASELNSDHFEIMRSSNGESFYSIGKIKAKGTSTVKIDYEFVDEKPLAGDNYYQLKSVDVDGYTENFKIVNVQREDEKIFSISPNPSSGTEITSYLNFVPEENAWMVIRDLMGQERVRLQVTSQKQEFTLASPLEAGVYHATVHTEGYNSVFRFIVR